MAAIYGLTGSRLPVHPPPLPDELLTHWFLRLAHANGRKAQGLADDAFGHPSTFWARDQDRYPSPGVVERLAELTGRDPTEIEALTLARHEGLNRTDEGRVHRIPWILPLGVYHRTRRNFGMQFCPLCLFEDAIPYFRRRWRLAFSTICDRHGVKLHDRCPGCGAPVVYFRNDLGHRNDLKLTNDTRCQKCGFDLCRAPACDPPAPDGRSVVALRSLVAFHDLGWWFVGDEALQYQHFYLEVLHHLVTLTNTARGDRLLGFIAQQTGWRAAISEKTRRIFFEVLPVEIRHKLLVSALWLLDEWPDRFICASKTCRLTQSRILNGESLPFWFESAVRLNLGSGYAVRTAEEAKHAAAYLERRGELSGKAVGRLLGSRDALVAKAYVKKKAGPTTDAEFQRWIEIISAEIVTLRSRSCRRLILQRDRTMFRLMQITGWSLKRILAMTVSDAARIASASKKEREFSGVLAGVLLTYLRDTRQYLVGGSSGDALFVGWHRNGIGENGFRLRVWRVGQFSNSS